jgi:hypothetical protein
MEKCATWEGCFLIIMLGKFSSSERVHFCYCVDSCAKTRSGRVRIRSSHFAMDRTAGWSDSSAAERVS